MWTSTARIYVNSEKTKVMAEGSPEAKFLLCPAGGQVSDVDCRRYGLGPFDPTNENITDDTGAEEAGTPTDTETEVEGPQR